jgi:hypothetical protein
MRWRAFVVEHLTKVTHVEPSAARWAAHDMVGLVRWLAVDPLADELAAWDVTHRASLFFMARPHMLEL